ncbi:2-amino-4-hydroxy-6-hydroxymethyldihydropteridine diphosphokinase [Paracoccus contaminans]|uniref:2-amino-4-hydroxy-6- hydroxymethyldihydropteridine diphosphokinase n=1 Tax=Paracoccus contaminans TaxID=1945662 RepID=UPI001F0A527B|nr:2-amino-4-hydroxy-6-hydroxymethyldihydropteridine diphosphokinase [Paracoccus contaminans]
MAGSPARTLRAALAMMAARGLALRAVSRFWRTPAHPAGSGPDYVNAAALVRADARPDEVLALLHAIEAHLGRTRDGGRWAARGIDLDLIAMGDTVLPSAMVQDRWRGLDPAAQARIAPEGLILPHPRLQERGFVLLPLAEIAPGWVHPRAGKSVAAMLAALDPAGLRGMVPGAG